MHDAKKSRQNIIEFQKRLMCLAMACLVLTSMFPVLIVNQAVSAVTPDTEIDEADSDRDGMPDTWEHEMGLDPGYPSDAWYDSDRDGYRNLAEFTHGTDPQNDTHFPDIRDEEDADGDGVCNFGEYIAGTDWTDALDVPGNKDTDGDGLIDVFELDFGDGNGTNYRIGYDLDPCDPDTDHDGYQDDGTDDDGNSADGVLDDNYTVGVDQPWMDYDDDHFIEGFNDGIELELGSNPLIPNTWEAFFYGYNFHPGKGSYEGRCIHRYPGEDYVDFTAPELACGHSLTEYVRDIRNSNIGETTIDPATCEASARDGWILVQHNYAEDGTSGPDVDYPYELYYNIRKGTLRLYARHQVSGNFDYGRILMFDRGEYPRPFFLNSCMKSETILDYRDVYAGPDNNDNEALIRGRYFFSEMFLGYERIEDMDYTISLSIAGIEIYPAEDDYYYSSSTVFPTTNIHLYPRLYSNECAFFTYSHQLGIYNLIPLNTEYGGYFHTFYYEKNDTIFLPVIDSPVSQGSLRVKLPINPFYLKYLDENNIKVTGKIIAMNGSIEKEISFDYVVESERNGTYYFSARTEILELENLNWTIIYQVNASIPMNYPHGNHTYYYSVEKTMNVKYPKKQLNNNTTQEDEKSNTGEGSTETSPINPVYSYLQDSISIILTGLIVLLLFISIQLVSLSTNARKKNRGDVNE